MYDVVVVGGRCAGAPLAMLLARAGHSVLVVDRTTFPSDIMSTHFIQSPGMARLAQWGLADTVLASNCPPVTKAFFDVGGEGLEFDIPLRPPIVGLTAPRRYILDKILIDAAVAAGATLAEGASVDSLLTDGDRVVGVRGHTSEGTFEERGTIVVGADGRNSVVAREVDAPYKKLVEPITGGYYNYYPDAGVTRTQLFFRDGFVCVMFPTNDGLTLAAIAWPKARFPEIRRDIEGSFDRALEVMGDPAAGVRASEPAERWVGTADIPNFIRRLHGPGWALVGDAGYHKDPTPADGISDAFRGAELLAEAIDSILSGRSSESDAFAVYERVHDEFADKHFDPAVQSARFDLTEQKRFDGFLESRLHDDVELTALLGEEPEAAAAAPEAR